MPILSTMVAPSFKEPSFVPFLDVSALIATTLHIQGHLILRPAMFPLELQVALLEPLSHPWLSVLNLFFCLS